jgi:hypothetical protein
MQSASDLRIELAAVKQKGEKARLEARRELLSLRAKLNPSTKNLQQMGESFNLAIYQHEIAKVFQSDVSSPSFLRIQAQLCHALHCHEIQLKQMQITQKHNRRVIEYLQYEISEITEDSSTRKMVLVNELASASKTLFALKEELECKAESQEEEINELMEQLGSTAIAYDDSFMQESFARLQDVLGPSFDPTLMHTPISLRKSKIWCDLQRHEEEDADALGELRKISFHHRTSLIGSNAASTKMERHHSGEFKIPSRNSIFSSFRTFGFGDDDEDEDAPRTPPTSRPILSRDSIREFVEHSEGSDGPLSPTSDALRKLSEEVFSL